MAQKKSPAKKSPKTEIDDEAEDANDSGPSEDGDPGDEDENRRLNAMVTGRVKRALAPMQKTLEALTARLEQLNKPSGSDSDDSDDGDDGDADQESAPAPTKRSRGADPKDKKLSSLEKRLKDAEDRASKAELATKQEQEKRSRHEEDQVVSAALQKAGITDPRVVKAITLTLRSEDLITRDEETNRVRFKVTDKWGSEDFVDPDSGITKWIKNDGKVFLPAVSASGSGAGGSNTANPSTGVGLSKDHYNKLGKVEKARIEIERASQGLPPLEG